MATPGARWLLSILLVNLPTCFAPAGPPARPSTPQCHIPHDEHVIHCIWEPGPDTQIPTNYTLYWKDTNSKIGYVKGTRVSGSIPRHDFTSHSEFHVWVQAANHYGTAQSEKIPLSGANIIKPPAPSVTTGESLESLEISWNSMCSGLELSAGKCDVRHRTEADQDWPEEEDGFYGSYTLESPEPYTVYEFQVRCACNIGLMSNWSKIHTVQSAEADPTGVLDVWRDCGISSTSLDCVLTWKKLPKLQARGHILGYEVRLTYDNGTATLVNLSIAKPRGQLVCEETQCHFNSPLKGVSSVNVSAYSEHGATLPAGLAMPTADKENSEQAIYIIMNREQLNVSWDLQPQLFDNLKEYVVQYKQAGSHAVQGFDWFRVNKNKKTAALEGSFENYTAYQVSLFAVSHSSNAHHISSVMGYSLQGIPSRVPSFEVISIDATHVTLSWQPVPLLEQRGEILCYQVGADSQNGRTFLRFSPVGLYKQVYNVSASPQHEKKTFLLRHLSPSQEYTVWVRAVTAAGPGAKTTQRFKTKEQEGYHPSQISLLLVPIVVVMACVICCRLFRGGNKACPWLPLWCNEKVPDPSNSHIFKQMKHQFNDSLAWICVPVLESHPKISRLEVVEIQPQAFESCLMNTFSPDGLTEQVVGDDCSQTDKQNNHMDNAVRKLDRDGTEHRCGREEYSRMVDSDEEQDREEEDKDNCLSSSEDEQLMSGYEKHFMPTALKVVNSYEEQDREEEDKDNCLSSSEDKQVMSGYEKHFMPTALEVLEV